jgi:hypothetical protein
VNQNIYSYFTVNTTHRHPETGDYCDPLLERGTFLVNWVRRAYCIYEMRRKQTKPTNAGGRSDHDPQRQTFPIVHRKLITTAVPGTIVRTSLQLQFWKAARRAFVDEVGAALTIVGLQEWSGSRLVKEYCAIDVTKTHTGRNINKAVQVQRST